MTREEAIETLKANYPDACFEQLRDAVDTAISALKQPEVDCQKCVFCGFAGFKQFQTEKPKTEERTAESAQNVSDEDSISRKAAIEWCRPEEWGTPDERWRTESEYGAMLEALPSAQPEIIRCKDCIKRDYCRTTNIWAVPPDDDWYCGDAERRKEP